ncbi:hypothetical protein [Candidatus Chloroploca asiatica]|uniref:Uncharacterized protein n=1 Tax=Candidatus Chloroploca asiatica TaxID=1506545 RepID=A0A2H3L366_9CHLR|nr:hypothetical protein [Candidatus Chloroploca asiatica]PDV99222.1 hypothetical protein A9Q02_12710 [Candidatus Chloroploca asiatica]
MLRTIPRIVLWLGILLIILGLISRYLIGLRGVSSLIPAIFGMPIALLGFLATEPTYYTSSMRGVTGLALLGLLINLHVIPLVRTLLRGEPIPDSIMSIIARSTMLFLCGLLLIVCGVMYAAAGWKRLRTSIPLVARR